MDGRITGQYSPQGPEQESQGGIITGVEVQEKGARAERLDEKAGWGEGALTPAQVHIAY